MSEEKRYYWYVVYTWANSKGTGFGHSNMHSKSEWFPIKEAIDYLVKNGDNKSVVILSWISISKEQHDQFTQEKK